MISEYCTGSAPSALSSVSDTSQYDRGLRFSVPPKITSSIFAPRSVFALCSPSTQRTASDILDLPLPLGPTTPVMPVSNTISVRSANDLNPYISSFLSFICAHRPPYTFYATMPLYYGLSNS